MTMKSGMMYDGAWFEGIPQGAGIETSPEGDIYVGEFLQGRKHG